MTAGLVVLTAVVTGLAVWILTRSSAPLQQSLNKFVVTPSPTAPLAEHPLNNVAISSDGKRILYVARTEGTTQLYVRSLDEFEATPIPGTEDTAADPFFSSDGEWVVFAAAGQLKRVSLTGGSVITLCDIENYRGGSWFEETIVFGASGPGGGLHRISAAGGEPELLATPDPERDETSYQRPEILPGGKAILFTITGPEDGDYRIAVLSLETEEQKILLQQGFGAYYAPTGHLVYTQPNTETLMAVPFDLQRLELTGDPVPILEGLSQYGDAARDYALSPSGALIYIPEHEYRYSPVWVDRKGTETLVTQEKREYASPNISPDGKQIIFSLRTTGRPAGVVIYDLQGDAFSRLTLEGAGGSPMWTPDGRWITFQAIVNGQRNIYRQLADRSGLPEQLTTYTDMNSKSPSSWSPDGRVLLFNQGGNPGYDILILNKEEDKEPQPFITTPNHECCSEFSPDGKWLAYVSNELGRNQVYVRPYPGPDIKFLVSEETEGGGEPVWSPDGRELFYRTGDKMMVVSIETEPTFRAGRPDVLFEGSYRSTPIPAGQQYYDITPDGQKFLMIKRDQAPAQINVVLNWFEELKRLVPTP